MDNDIDRARKDRIEQLISNMKGPVRDGHDVIIDGRLVPNMTMFDNGETISFCLDNRMVWGSFPRELARHVASFAANAMAIGAGYPCLEADRKPECFATPCQGLDLGE